MKDLAFELTMILAALLGALLYCFFWGVVAISTYIYSIPNRIRSIYRESIDEFK